MLSFDDSTRCFLRDARPIELSDQEIEEMNSHSWWQSIPFAPGIRPKAHLDPSGHAADYLMNRVDFRGKRVLDIGCWDGYQIFLAEALGATRTVGLDDCSQRDYGIGARSFAHRILGSKTEFVDGSVYDLSKQTLGTFDIVMMFGVLYHLVHPMLGVEKACGVCDHELLMATHVTSVRSDELPVCRLYPRGEMDQGTTNWSAPNSAWVNSAIEMQGFSVVETNIYKPTRMAFHAHRIANRVLSS